ncbi:hypothetical protein N657DRAFT_683159 [Parathielavia appendiculata]|uniref:Uncharacterized protein n=1 Tax=Parathielavia appendiculata TaxID=2587402 RepID=A0AAN6Z111_9PEZI|nr:hypothetical protein N657DRAFT_683159 [Parathielavia appendiculata]
MLIPPRLDAVQPGTAVQQLRETLSTAAVRVQADEKQVHPSAVVVSQRPAFAVSLSPPPAHRLARSRGFESLAALRQQQQQQLPAPRHLPLLSPPWGESQQRGSQDAADAMLSNWPGFDVFGRDPAPTSTSSAEQQQYSWTTDQQSLSMCFIACEDGCTAHSDEVHDAIRSLNAYHVGSHQNHWAGGSNTWATQGYSAWTLVPDVAPAAVVANNMNMPWLVADPTQDLVQVPVTRPMTDAELLSVWVKFVSQFTASLDGNPDASNPYIKYYVPYCVNSQLLAHVAIYSTACFLSDTAHVERTAAMAHKGHVIKLLNEHIRSQLSASDEVIAGVVQLVVAEWLWGNTDDLQAHLCGLRDMIKCRGGIRTLGLHGLISKLAISADIAIALSFEVSPFLRDGPEFEFEDHSQVPLRLALNTPLISNLVRFSLCVHALRIHPAVASILDDMRFLLCLILALPEKPSAKELQKVHTTSAWIHDRTLSLPADSPAGRGPSTASYTPTSRGSSAVPETLDLDEKQARPGRGDPRLGSQQSRRASSGQIPPVTQVQRQRPQVPQSQSSPHPPPPLPSLLPNPTITATTTASASQPGTTTTNNNDLPDNTADTEAEQEGADYVYQTVRLAALLYCRAIKLRQPFSLITTPAEFLSLWTTAWRVPLSKWRCLLGVFNFVLLPLVSYGMMGGGGGRRRTGAGSESGTGTGIGTVGGRQQQPQVQVHDRFVKGMMNISLFQMGLENWGVAREVMGAGLRLQGWLVGQSEEGESASSSESGSNPFLEAQAAVGIEPDCGGGGRRSSADDALWRGGRGTGTGSDGGATGRAMSAGYGGEDAVQGRSTSSITSNAGVEVDRRAQDSRKVWYGQVNLGC